MLHSTESKSRGQKNIYFTSHLEQSQN